MILRCTATHLYFSKHLLSSVFFTFFHHSFCETFDYRIFNTTEQYNLIQSGFLYVDTSLLIHRNLIKYIYVMSE